MWGWIEGLRKSFDDKSFLQRYTPRRKKSLWSQINREHVARLTKAGKMTVYGLAQVEAAKADGRWAKAYAASGSRLQADDLLAAIADEPKALETYRSLNSTNCYALAFRLHNTKTDAGRKKKMFVEMLKRGRTIYPQKAPKRVDEAGAQQRYRHTCERTEARQPVGSRMTPTMEQTPQLSGVRSILHFIFFVIACHFGFVRKPGGSGT
jgi:Bacteriocin-protection, YdeI or OmpD-Associated